MRFTVVLLFSLVSVFMFSQRNAYYEVLKSGNKKQLLLAIDNIPNVGSQNLKKAFLGALYCKLASCQSKVTDKIRDFKKGAELLESSISHEPSNIELRFLRLIIQENAPPILHYNTQIENDCLLIKNAFSRQTNELKLIITDYAKSSGKLTL